MQLTCHVPYDSPCCVCAVQAKEIELALRSGVHTTVSWSLNVLTVLSFNAAHHLLLAEHPHLLEALLEVCLEAHTGFPVHHRVICT